MRPTNQSAYDVRCEWGLHGVTDVSRSDVHVRLAAELDVSDAVPLLRDGAFVLAHKAVKQP